MQDYEVSKKEKITSVYTVDHQIFEGSKPDWCPLRDLPKKLEEDIGDYEEMYYVGGWNECIDEILKGANGNDERTV